MGTPQLLSKNDKTHTTPTNFTFTLLFIRFGGPPYLLPLVRRDKVYNLLSLVRNIEGYGNKEFFACGAGAGPWPVINQNCEGIINLKADANGPINNFTNYVHVNKDGTEYSIHEVNSNETRTALLGKKDLF